MKKYSDQKTLQIFLSLWVRHATCERKRHATRNIGRYREKSKDIFSLNLVGKQIEKYRIILETIESNEKRKSIIWPK